MKKFFLLIPALVLAVAINAKEIEIGSGTSNIIHYTIADNDTEDGDVIVLTSDGDQPYFSTAGADDYTRLVKNLTIKAADGVNPVVKLEVPFRSTGGKTVKFIGITFDGTSLTGYDWYFRFYDANDNLEFEDCEFKNISKYVFDVYTGKSANSLKLTNCKLHDISSRGILNRGTLTSLEINGGQIYNFTGYPVLDNYDGATLGKVKINGTEFYNNAKDIISGVATSHADSCIINNCYFHNNSRSAVYFAASTVDGVETCDGVIVKNSTFANNDLSASSRSVIEVQNYGGTEAANIEVTVDHCTFYNNTTVNYDYSCVRSRKSTKVNITNSIFAYPSAIDFYATNCYGGTISNTLVYNLSRGHRSSGGAPAITNTITGDPLFTDAANADYSFPGNWVSMNISPARAAATDGSDLGDPRWHSAETLPSTAFASPYQFTGDKALLSGNIWYDSENAYLYGDGEHNKVYGTAKWKFHAEKACALQVAVNINSLSTGSHKLRVDVLDANGNNLGEYAEQTHTLPGSLVIPAAGDYIVILNDDQTWSSAKIDNVTLTYIGGDVQAMPGTTDIDEAWFSSNGTRTAGEKIVIPAGYQHEGWVKWNVNFANAANYKAKVNINASNGHNYTVALYKDENDLTPITWGEGGQTEHASPLDLGAKEVPAGNYILKVTNAVQYSNAELISVQFIREGGGLVDIPGAIDFNEVILSERAYVDENGEIRFTDDDHAGYVEGEWAKWRLNVSKAGYYKFTTSVNSSNGHSYLVSVYNADETILEGSVPQSGDDIWGAPKTFSSENIYLEVGEYLLKVQNTTKDSKGRIVSISASYEGGAVVNIPNNTISLEEAVVTSGTDKSASEINFHGHIDESAMWNMQAEEGLYTFTINITGTNYSKMELTIIDSENHELYKKDKGVSGSGAAVHSGIFMPSGAYVIKVANVNPSADGCVNSFSAALADDVIILDETVDNMDQLIAADGQSRKPVIKREFKGGMYNTICVPFNVSTSSELEGIFGVGYELLEMTAATLSGNELTLNFDAPANNIEYGRPYLIKPTQDVKNPVFSSHTIQKSTSHLIVEGDAANFIGNLIADEVPAGENNLFLGPNNLLYFSQTATPIKGMRAYFHVKAGGAQVIKHARIVKGTQVITAIDLVGDENNTLKTIENGQLIIIRDGVRYNVMGNKIQ